MTEKKILLIDDDREMTDEVSEILTDDGYLVTVANDGADGDQLLQSNCYDLVLLDLKMPRMDGFTVFKRLKERCPTAKVVIMTATPLGSDLLGGHNSLSAECDSILHQADGIVKKPYNIEAMLKIVHAAIDSPSPSGK